MKPTSRFFCLLLLLSCQSSAQIRAAKPVIPPLGEKVEDFQLRTARGVAWKLSDTAGKKAVVLAFVGTECPLVKLYAGRLSRLQREFESKGVEFVGLNSNTQDSVTEMTAFENRYKISFPILKDVGHRVADQLGATRTPEVVVLDAEHRIRYRGRIDDQYEVGISKPRPGKNDLAAALNEILAGKRVSVPQTVAVGCFIGRAKETKPTGEVTYASHIAQIFNKRCVECHRKGEIAPFVLTGYKDILGWEDTILEVIEDNRMPPWNANPNHGKFANDARLSPHEKNLIRTWVKNGMPQGDLAKLPKPRRFVEGWRIGTPDQIVRMRNRPFRVPAQGVVDYKYFWVDPGWKEGKYIKAAEARPQNVAVVHHIIVYVQPPNQEGDPRLRDMLVGYAPGAEPTNLPDGQGIYVPAGSKLLFEMHYTPTGEAQDDLSYVGFKFTDKASVKQLLQGKMAINQRFTIPAHEANEKVTAEYRSHRDELLISMTPHMHLRGKSFRYHAFFPNGRDEILLDVPRYDFNWQLTYRLAKPKLLPKGTRIVCTAVFDNSELNPVNPDASKEVKWGEQSWEEMMIGFFAVIPPLRENQDSVVGKPKVDPSGVWTWKLRNELQSLTLKMKDRKITGFIRAEGRETAIRNVLLKGDVLTFEMPLKSRGILLNFRAKVGPKRMQGTAGFVIEAIGREQSFPWVATRKQE